MLAMRSGSQDGSHAEDVTLRFQHDGGELIADLRINDALLPRGHFLKYQRPGGGGYVLLNEFNRTTAALCHYKVSERTNVFGVRRV